MRPYCPGTATDSGESVTGCVACAAILRVSRRPDWQDGRKQRLSDDREVLMRIQRVIAEVPTYGYRRVWALLRRESESEGLKQVNAKNLSGHAC